MVVTHGFALEFVPDADGMCIVSIRTGIARKFVEECIFRWQLGFIKAVHTIHLIVWVYIFTTDKAKIGGGGGGGPFDKVPQLIILVGFG